MLHVVVITQRPHDFMAAIEDQPAYWGCGEDEERALGDLIRTHPAMFGITLKMAKE